MCGINIEPDEPKGLRDLIACLLLGAALIFQILYLWWPTITKS